MRLRELFEGSGSYKDYYSIKEDISDLEMSAMIDHVNSKWARFNLSIDFGTHFGQRLNDPRNKPPITLEEVAQLFNKMLFSAAKAIYKLPNPYHAVMRHNDINVMFVIVGDKGGPRTIVLKSIIRKHDFESKSKVFTANPVITKPNQPNVSL